MPSVAITDAKKKKKLCFWLFVSLCFCPFSLCFSSSFKLTMNLKIQPKNVHSRLTRIPLMTSTMPLKRLDSKKHSPIKMEKARETLKNQKKAKEELKNKKNKKNLKALKKEPEQLEEEEKEKEEKQELAPSAGSSIAAAAAAFSTAGESPPPIPVTPLPDVPEPESAEMMLVEEPLIAFVNQPPPSQEEDQAAKENPASDPIGVRKERTMDEPEMEEQMEEPEEERERRLKAYFRNVLFEEVSRLNKQSSEGKLRALALEIRRPYIAMSKEQAQVDERVIRRLFRESILRW